VSEPDHERRGPIAWMARHSIAANLLMAILLVGGFWSALRIQKEVFPEFQMDIVEVRVEYPGAAPTEVEQGVILPVEETIRGVEGIKEIQSRAREGAGTVTIELVAGGDRMRAFQDIDQAVSRITTFPDDIEQPEVRLRASDREVMELVLYGEIDIRSLRRLAERLRDQLLNEETITQVALDNAPDYVTHVEIPRDRLREHGLTLDRVAAIIRDSSEDVAAGAVRTGSGEILLRMKERKQFAGEFGDIEILASESGSSVTLADLAELRDGFEEEGFHSRFNQSPSVEIKVFRVGDQSPLDISRSVQEVMEDFESTLPPGVEWRIDSNSAKDYDERMSLLIENGLLAVLIVMAILSLFLDLRLAFWVMMGMSASFIGGIIFLPMIDVSISMISMFAFLVAIGIVVDDAIVVGENIHEHRRHDEGALQSAIRGAREIAAPVTFSIITNIVAFVPLLFIPGETGKFWKPLPAVVIVVLAISLLEALFILPAHLGHARRNPRRTRLGQGIRNAQQAFARGFDGFVDRHYRRFLHLSLRFRYVTITAALALFAVVGGYATSSHMGMILMPAVSADEIEAGIDLPVGVTPEQAAQVALDVTASTREMFVEHDLGRVAEGIKTNVRRGSFIDVEIVMKPPDQRDMTAAEVIELWRDQIGDIPGVDQITFSAEAGPSGYRPDITVSLSHSDIAVLEAASRDLLAEIEKFETTRDVGDDYNKGKTQFDFRLRPEGRALGLTSEDVGRQLRDSFYGALALRQLRGTNEVEVRVKLPEAEREDLHHLEDLVIFTPGGTEVPLFDVVEIGRGEAFTSINRRDGRRVVNVSTDVEPKRAITRVITALRGEVLPQLRADHPGITWTFEGSEADMRESTAALWGSFGLALAVIYSLLAVAFRSYIQPFIVLAAIPFGIVGAVIGHILLGFDLSLISLMGVIALSGVVVNDSLIMIDFANRNRGDLGAFEAIGKAGVRRFRPIILTTATTFGGLTPIILERSLQAQYLIPMAISLGFGIVFATAIILLLVPCLYLALEDLKRLVVGGPRNEASSDATAS
jgi:multidrug efflux pump subunit AcrB